MHAAHRKLTAIERSLIEEARAHYMAEEFDAAKALTQEGLERSEHPRFKRFYARLLMQEGREDAARQILSALMPAVHKPGDWEMALAGGHVRVYCHDGAGICYFPVPKCGSTSIRNIFLQLDGISPKGEAAHAMMAPYEHIVRRNAPLVGMKILTVREPIARLRSYFRGNVQERASLKKELGGRERFYGLSTQPSYGEFLARLEEYRRVFIPVRHHLLAITDMVGRDIGYFDWAGHVRDMAKLIERIEAHTGRALTAVHDMKSAQMQEAKGLMEAEKLLQVGYYKADYETFDF